jgi:uncharacterized DUF497 family protein
VHTIGQVNYEWDPRKAERNRRKHGIDFADAVGIFSDPLAITIPDRYRNEERFVTVGVDFLGRILVVVYTWRGRTIRMISARRATGRERRNYEGYVHES